MLKPQLFLIGSRFSSVIYWQHYFKYKNNEEPEMKIRVFLDNARSFDLVEGHEAVHGG